MRRWLVSALVVLLVAFAARPAAAQPPKIDEFPMKLNGGKPGAVVEFFLNSGKRGELVLDGAGLGELVLNMGNSSKTKLTMYVDVCRDGQVVKVLFTEGEPRPHDEGCNRRMLIAGFYKNCGMSSLTLDLTRMFGKAAGCGFSLTSRKGLTTIGGGLVGVVALTTIGGGGSPTAISTSPPPQPPAAAPTVTSTPPSTSPPSSTPPSSTPPSAPPAPPAPSANGNYSCVACNPSSDPARHDPFIALCRAVTALFSVVQGSITISHPAPFVSITGDYNTTTGAFTATGRGTVAGFPNVGVRGEGTVNTTTGRITMTYTMGTGGELPGGQAISYALTLQKQ